MSEAAISMDALAAQAEEADAEEAFFVDTEGYEGPLHMLLDMARRQKVDLLQVSILDLANQYLKFIKSARSKRIDLAADYLLMAAWLAYLKSRLLLPKVEKSEDGELSGDDLAKRLAFRLKRLEAMRKAGEELMNGPLLGNVVFLRGAPEQPKVIKHTEYSTTTYHMTQAFGAMRKRKEEAAPHRIEKQFVLPLEAARNSLRSILPDLEDWESLNELRKQVALPGEHLPQRSVLASMFSATLELARDGDVDVRQNEHFTPLYVRGIMESQQKGVHHDPA